MKLYKVGYEGRDEQERKGYHSALVEAENLRAAVEKIERMAGVVEVETVMLWDRDFKGVVK